MSKGEVHCSIYVYIRVSEKFLSFRKVIIDE